MNRNRWGPCSAVAGAGVLLLGRLPVCAALDQLDEPAVGAAPSGAGCPGAAADAVAPRGRMDTEGWPHKDPGVEGEAGT